MQTIQSPRTQHAASKGRESAKIYCRPSRDANRSTAQSSFALSGYIHERAKFPLIRQLRVLRPGSFTSDEREINQKRDSGQLHLQFFVDYPHPTLNTHPG